MYDTLVRKVKENSVWTSKEMEDLCNYKRFVDAVEKSDKLIAIYCVLIIC